MSTVPKYGKNNGKHFMANMSDSGNRIKSGVSDKLWHGRKFFNVTANLGENDGSKSSANARYRLKFGVKIIHKAGNLFVKSDD